MTVMEKRKFFERIAEMRDEYRRSDGRYSSSRDRTFIQPLSWERVDTSALNESITIDEEITQ